MNSDFLEKLLQSKKYRDVSPDAIRRIWDECSRKYKKPKDAEKAAREALHGITGAFMTPAEVTSCARAISAWADGPRTDAQLEAILTHHASTRERLPVKSMDALCARIFEITGCPTRILDLACGINPIYLGARGLAAVGVDISGSAAKLVNDFGQISGAPVSAACADLLNPESLPREPFDLALLFKILPLLERQRPGAAVALLNAIDVKYLAVSFPTRTLGGRNVGMADHYAQWMADHLPENRTIAGRFGTENELFYILR